MDKRYLTVQELSDYLGVSRWSLYKLVQQRRIPFIPLGIDENKMEPKRLLVRFDIAEIDRWMKQRAVTPIRKS